MTKYIDADAVCYQLEKQENIDGQPRAIRRARRIVAKFPAANVRQTVMGRWEIGGIFDDFGVCSNCGWKYPLPTVLTEFHFCPNCGADMREAADE